MDVRLSQFQEALHGFGYLARLDMANQQAQLPDKGLVDGTQNGRAQKFEYTAKLCWNAIKSFLKATQGIDEASPKKIITAYYLAGCTSEDDYLQRLDTIEDRNVTASATCTTKRHSTRYWRNSPLTPTCSNAWAPRSLGKRASFTARTDYPTRTAT